MQYPTVDFRSIPLFAGVTDAEWNDWTWHMKNGIRDIETLEKVVKLTHQEREQIQLCLGKFTMEITPNDSLQIQNINCNKLNNYTKDYIIGKLRFKPG